jgi:hypothetical protein
VRSRLPGGDNRDNRDNRDTGDAGRVGAPRELSVNVPARRAIRIRASNCVQRRAGDDLGERDGIAGRRIGEVGPQGGRATGFGSIIGTRPRADRWAGRAHRFHPNIERPSLAAVPHRHQLTFNAQVDGRLILAINDDDYSDNGGNFAVRIRVN